MITYFLISLHAGDYYIELAVTLNLGIQGEIAASGSLDGEGEPCSYRGISFSRPVIVIGRDIEVNCDTWVNVAGRIADGPLTHMDIAPVVRSYGVIIGVLSQVDVIGALRGRVYLEHAVNDHQTAMLVSLETDIPAAYRAG